MRPNLFLACVLTTIMVLMAIACGRSVYEPNCGNPFNACVADSLVNSPTVAE